MKSKTETAETIHGSIEYKTVECTSCGNEVAETDALDYVAGDIMGVDHWGHRDAYEFSIDDATLHQGHLCPYCADAGPFTAPPYKWRQWITFDRAMVAMMVLMGLGTAVAMVVSALL